MESCPNDKPKKTRKPKAKAKTEPKKKEEAQASPESKTRRNVNKKPAAKKAPVKPKTDEVEKPAPKRKSKSKALDEPKQQQEDKTDNETPVKKQKTGEIAEGKGKGKGKEPAGKRKTWASRWVPTCPIALKKFESIRKVFEECCAPKLRSQSTLQSPFFMQCTKAFASQNISDDAPMEDFIACAELQVDAFMASDPARRSAFNLY